MKKFVSKLDEADVRRESPVADVVDGWFFRCREVSAGVHKSEGTDLWGRRVGTEGTNPEELLQDCAESARRIRQHVTAILFHEYGTQLRAEGDELILNVLCGGVGQFGVEFALNEPERERYRRDGDSFIQDLAGAVRRDPNAYGSRGKFC